MPHLLTIQEEDSQLSLWLMGESPDELRGMIELNKAELEIMKGLSHEKRLREWLSVRALLRLHFGISQTLAYDERGKPHLPETGLHVSISHSRAMAAVYIHQHHPVGLDTEGISPRLDALKTKFMSPEEIQNTPQENALEYMGMHWCGKEAMLKREGNRKLDFCNDLTIRLAKPINQKGEIIGQIKPVDEELKLSYRFMGPHLVVWTQ